jgi:hypothetical protein
VTRCVERLAGLRDLITAAHICMELSMTMVFDIS